MAQFNITITEELLHGLFLSNGRDKAFSKLLEEIFNQVLLAQSSEQLRAEPYERTEERTAYRNGYRNRELTTRLGTLTLRVPRHRNGQFSTELFDRYQRSEQALVLAMMEMVIKCHYPFLLVDAIYVKVRENGRIRSRGINAYCYWVSGWLLFNNRGNLHTILDLTHKCLAIIYNMTSIMVIPSIIQSFFDDLSPIL